MKKIILLLALGALAFSSCSKESVVQDEAETQLSAKQTPKQIFDQYTAGDTIYGYADATPEQIVMAEAVKSGKKKDGPYYICAVRDPEGTIIGAGYLNGEFYIVGIPQGNILNFQYVKSDEKLVRSFCLSIGQG